METKENSTVYDENKLHELQERVLTLAFMQPKAQYCEEYLFLASEAYRLYRKIRTVALMDLPMEIELPYLEKQVRDVEGKMENLCGIL